MNEQKEVIIIGEGSSKLWNLQEYSKICEIS